jgi:hypothetical protein
MADCAQRRQNLEAIAVIDEDRAIIEVRLHSDTASQMSRDHNAALTRRVKATCAKGIDGRGHNLGTATPSVSLLPPELCREIREKLARPR